MNEIIYNDTDTQREYLAISWMINTLTEQMNDSQFYDLMMENLPSPLPRYRRNEYPRWDWTNSKVSSEEFEEFLQSIKLIVKHKIDGIERRNWVLIRRMRDEKKAKGEEE